MKTTNVVVNLQIPGLHAWPGVTKTKYKENQGYLQYAHRHMFKITAEKPVRHNDRDIEIIDLKNRIRKFLYANWWNDELGLADFGQMSCETIADLLVGKFDLSKCTVLEDGENGATVTSEFPFTIETKLDLDVEKKSQPIVINPNLKDFNIAFVCGYMRSGKTTIAKGYYNELKLRNKNVAMIEISDIVKRHVSSTQRSDLQGHPELSRFIIDEIKNAAQYYEYVVVSGVRQVEILKAFPIADMIWVESPVITRFMRYQNSDRDKDKGLSQFAQFDKRDNELGIKQVKQYILNRG